MAEQATHNRQVTGSNPVGATLSNPYLGGVRKVFHFSEAFCALSIRQQMN